MESAAPPEIDAEHEAESNANVRVEPGSESLAAMWSRVMRAVEQIPSIAVATEPMRPIERKGSTIRLGAPARSVKMFSDYQREKLEAEVAKVFGSSLRVEVVAEAVGTEAESLSMPAATEREVDAAARAEAMRHPVVKKAAELFDAKLIRVEPAE